MGTGKYHFNSLLWRRMKHNIFVYLPNIFWVSIRCQELVQVLRIHQWIQNTMTRKHSYHHGAYILESNELFSFWASSKRISSQYNTYTHTDIHTHTPWTLRLLFFFKRIYFAPSPPKNKRPRTRYRLPHEAVHIDYDMNCGLGVFQFGDYKLYI